VATQRHGADDTVIAAAPVRPQAYHKHYVATVAAPGKARHDIAFHLHTWHLDQVVDTAQLVVSELVTNVITHTSARTVGVFASRTLDTVQIIVTDTSGHTPHPATPGSTEENGRGLLLVDALATRWGSERVPGGKRVWANISTTLGPAQ
jgi:serine/threonine-protein kinase RsbW